MYNLQKAEMLRSKATPFDEDLEKATNENNLTDDWTLIMRICDNVVNYQDGAKFCLKAIIKRLHHSVPRVAMSSLTILDACVKNCDRRFLLQVASSEFTTEIRKLLSKMHPTAAMKLKELLQKWSLKEFKDDPELGIIPSLYYKLKSEGAEFPSEEESKKPAPQLSTDPNAVSSQEEENDIIKALEISLMDTGRYALRSDGKGGLVPSAATPAELFKTRAIYDFDADEDNELTIKAGEIVVVLDNSNANWWKGSNHRGEGLFPANFVTEDLEAKIDEPKVEIDDEVSETNTTFVGEVQLDEKKIENVLNWLTDVDPTEELPDSKEMLVLEDEVYQMTPLIEDSLQNIDNRLAKLNAVNVKIIEAFDLFHSLSDNYLPGASSMKYYAVNPMQIANMQASIPTSMAAQNHPASQQPAMYIPATLPISQFQPENSQAPVLNALATHSTNVAPNPTAQSVDADNSISILKEIPLTAAPAQLAVSASSSNRTMQQQNNGFYVPQPFPFLPQQGYVAPGVPGNMNMYSMPPAGSYIPVPYYFINSPGSVPTAQTNSQTVSSENQYTEAMSTSQSSTSYVTSSSTAVAQTLPTYSNDLQQLPYSSSASLNKAQPTVQESPSNITNSDNLNDMKLALHTG